MPPVDFDTTTQYKHPLVYAWSESTEANRVDLSPDVIAFSFSKGLTDNNGFYSPSGRFSVTLMPRSNLDPAVAALFGQPAAAYRQIHPQTLISIGYDTPGGVCLGLVDEVTENFEFSGPQVGRTLTISGRDMGKVLEMDNIVRAPISAADEPAFVADLQAELGEDFPIIDDALNLFSNNGGEVITFFLQSIRTILDWILEHFPGMRIPVLKDAFGRQGQDDAEVATWLDTALSVLVWDDERVYRDAPDVQTGSLISFIQSFLDPDFYELWIDSVPVEGSAIPQPMLVLRPRPFDERPYIAPVTESPGITWSDLQTLVSFKDRHEIPRSQVVRASFGKSDAQAITFVQCQNANELGAGDEAVKQGLAFPLVDTWGVNRYGMRAYTPRLALVSGDPTLAEERRQSEISRAVSPTLVEKRNRLFNWYRWNPWYETGSVRVYGKDEYRIGERIFLPWRADYLTNTEGMEYYCTGVTHSWTDGQGYFCDLTLTRGHNGEMLNALMERVERESSTLPLGFTKVNA